jgi:hypothetical protein
MIAGTTTRRPTPLPHNWQGATASQTPGAASKHNEQPPMIAGTGDSLHVPQTADLTNCKSHNPRQSNAMHDASEVLQAGRRVPLV